MFVDFNLATARLDQRIAEAERDRQALQAVRARRRQKDLHPEASPQAAGGFIRRSARAIVQLIGRRPVF